MLNKLAFLPYGLILISHSQEKEIETRTGKHTRIVPTLPDKARKIVIGLVDLILFCDLEMKPGEDGKPSWQRVMRTKPSPNYDAGDRTGRLPEVIPLDFPTFIKAFSNTAAGPAAGAARPKPEPSRKRGGEILNRKECEQWKPTNQTDNLDLAQFDDAFQAAEVEEREFDTVPDGKYQVNVDRVELTRAQTSGNPMLKWTLRIIAPTHKGRMLWRNNVMASSENIKWLKQDLYTCGLQLTKLSDLPGYLAQLLNIKLEVTKRTRGENENIYFNRRIVLADDPGVPGAAMEDMIPF